MIIVTAVILFGGLFVFIQLYRKGLPKPDQSQIPEVDLNQITPAGPGGNGNRTVVVGPQGQQPGQEETITPDPDSSENQSNEPEENSSEETTPSEPGNTVPDEIKLLITEAVKDRQAGQIIMARDKLNEVLKKQPTPALKKEVKARMAELSNEWLFSKDVLKGDTLTSLYKVMQDDYISTIGNNHKVPYEFLMDINGITDARNLRAGVSIKVVHGPFHTVVNRRTFTMDIYLQDMYVKSYPVGVGEDGRETPPGLWKVPRNGKHIKPVYTHPVTGKVYIPSNPEYPIGSRYIKLLGIDENTQGKSGFAIHGTKDPDSIGKRSSLGCVRLFNGDVIEVYNMLFAGQSLVKVVE